MASTTTSERLLRALAEELKLPLLQIAHQSEAAQGSEAATEALQAIGLSAAQALWFVDTYLLSQQLQQASLNLEPVAVSAVLDDAAHSLSGLAKQYGCHLELQLSGRYGPVMAHRQGLQAAMVGLGTSLIGAGQAQPGQRLVLAGHKTRGGVVAGVFSATNNLSQTGFRRGQALYGRAGQPLPEFSSQASAGIFMAAELLSSMQSRLRVAHHHKLTGLAATLLPSYQLALV
ncbi:MAG: hypothetical protein ABI221_01605 [Candidatus Saccharimonadales bacterium]